MIYNPGIYQLRENAIIRMMNIIKQGYQACSGGVVLFGDSIFELYDVTNLGIRNVYNCGICGATTDELLWFIDEGVLKYEPREVIIHVGTNDLGNTVMHSPREIVANIEVMCNIIRRNLSDCKIVVVAPLPCLEEQEYDHVLGIRCNKFIKDIRLLFDEFLDVDVIDLYDDFINKDYLYADGLHPNALGYEILTKRLKEVVVE